MYYASNEFGMVLFSTSDPARDRDATALISQPQWDGSGRWAIAYTDNSGNRQHVRGFRNPWVARRAAVDMGVWK